MKRIIAIVLCMIMVAVTFSGCVAKEDPGATLNVIMKRPTTLDPAIAYADQASAQFLTMIYQGLFTINEKGELKKSMCKSYTVKDNVIEFTLKETCWSDGTKVDADDYVYAWKRLLDAEFNSGAASLLFYIKNAKEVKNGDMPIDDLCLYASGNSIISVELIDASFVDTFIYNTASVALYPLREDIVNKISISEPYYDAILNAEGESILNGNAPLNDFSWGSLSSVLVSCGPFYVKKFDHYPESGNSSVTLERNKYYYRDTSETSDDTLQKYVTPGKILVEFYASKATESAAAAYEAYKAGTLSTLNEQPILLDANLPLAARSSNDNVHDLSATYTYFFNTSNPLFEKAEVRRALSAVLDRNQIASIAVYGKPATGVIADGVFYTTKKTSFREKAGTTIGVSMSVADAKAAISAAGASTGAIKLTVRDDEAEIKIAEYVKSMWEQLGYTVDIESTGIASTKFYQVVGKKEGNYDVQPVYDGLTRDIYIEKYISGEFDVIGVHYSMLSTDPFAALGSFASIYSGNAYDFSESAEEFAPVKHVTGYDSEEYEGLIENYLSEKDAEKRAAILVEAEKLLLQDAPVAPLYFMQNGYVASDRIKNVSYTRDGFIDFIKATDKDYVYTVEAVVLPVKRSWLFD